MRNRRTTIGILSDEVANGYSAPILSELISAALERGVGVTSFVDWLSPEDLQRRVVTDLADPSSVDAILLLSLGYSVSAADLAAYCERFRPLPMCSIADVAAPWCSRVYVDNEPGMREGVEHLVETHGYRSVAFVRGPEMSEEADTRYRVYREVLEKNGIAFDPALVAPGWYTIHSGIEAVRLIFDERKQRPRAIAAANDGMALGVLEALSARGISVPEQVAVVGFDDVDIARYADSPLTTVRQPMRQVGRAALELLLAQLEPGSTPVRRVLPSKLVIRESCGCGGYQGDEPDARASRAPGDASRGLAAFAAGLDGLARAVRAFGIPEAPNTDWPEKLCRAFVDELAAGRTGFLTELRQVLAVTARIRGDVGGFHKVVTLLWQRARRCIEADAPEWSRADLLLHAARLMISGVVERMQTGLHLRFEDTSQKLFRTNSALGLAVDQKGVQQTLMSHMPLYGITACYVCLYGSTRNDPARVILGVRGDGELDLPPDGLSIPPTQLLPEELLASSAPQTRVAGPLFRSGNSPGYVVFENGPLDGFLYETLFAQIGGALQRLELVTRLVAEAARREAAERARIEEELSIATRIQTSILPRSIHADGLEISALMLPATEVGGDYYDVIPVRNGCFIGIGDVAGHGVPAGLVMLMLQSVVSGLSRSLGEARPSDVLPIVNAVLYENIRDRMAQDEYVTLSLLRHGKDGQITFAGAHEDILIFRAADGSLEWIPTPGTWIAATREIRSSTVDTSFALAAGDVMVLYTDGVTEARDPAGEVFGPERLAAALQSVGREPVEAIRDHLLASVRRWMAPRPQEDDITLLVARQHAVD